MFSQTFEGQTRSRPTINLSGNTAASTSLSTASSSSSSLTASTSTSSHAGPSNAGDSIAKRARLERAHREHQRKLDRNVRTIQAFYRSRTAARVARDQVRRQFDELTIGSKSISNSPQQSTTSSDSSLLRATSLLAFILSPVTNAASQKTRPRCSKADLDRLGRWSRTVAVGKPRVALFQQFADLAGEPEKQVRYAFLLRRIARAMLAQAADHPNLPLIPLFLELVKQLLDPAKFSNLTGGVVKKFPQQLASTLIDHGALKEIRAHILSFPNNVRPIPPSLSPIISISLSLLVQTDGSVVYPNALEGYLHQILTIPGLLSPSRVSATTLNTLTGPKSTLPLWDLLEVLQDPPRVHFHQQNQCAYLLANLASIVTKRLLATQSPTSSSPVSGGIKNGKELAAILNGLKVCLEATPQSLLANEPKGKGVSTAIDISMDVDEEEDILIGSTDRASATLDLFTYNNIEALTSEATLSAVVTASTRYSASSRPALSAFLVALIYSWPTRRESIVNTLVYSDMVAAGRGIIRELWRGWVRTSGLMKAMVGSTGGAGTSSVTTNSTIAALSNMQFKDDWPHLLLLAELYSRTLLTLGDDEFFASATNAPSRVNTAPTNTRNPLTIDEVIGLSGLFRNIAFALYWQSEALANTTTGQPNYVGTTKVSFEKLRGLSTHLLQMLHARDSRRQFTPPNHWIMTSQIDLHSFIESVLHEDRALNEDNAVSAQDGMELDSDDEGRYRPRQPILRKRNIPSRRQMAFVSPRLGVLNNIPFVIPFETRVSIFQQFVANDRQRAGLAGVDSHFNFGMDGRQIAGRGTIRRGHIADDGFRYFNSLGSHLKGRLAIRFIDEHGQEEAGIDGGGLFKEFLTSLSKEAFDIDRGLWVENHNHELYPTSTSYSRESHSLQWYAFLGRMMGKALYEGILVDVPFAPFFLSKWLGRASGFDDLASYDPDLYQGLVQLKNYSGNVEKDLSLNFTVAEEDFGVSRQIDLIPGGSSVPVTNENRISYIYRVSDYRLNKQIERQCSAFFSGLSDLVDPKWLRMFNQVELGLLVGGAETGIDVNDLRHNTVYPRGYDEAHPSIQYFWKVVESLSQQDKKALVKFCTSCPRPPLLGFGQLNPKFSIAPGGDDENRMPSASTCVNLLKLPAYSSQEQLKRKLLASIHSGAGFDLS